MTQPALIRGAAVGGVLVGVLALGTAPAYAWFTTGPNGETICQFGGSYPDCNEAPTAGTTTSGGDAVQSPAPQPSETASSSESPAPTPSPTAATTQAGGAAGGTNGGSGSATTTANTADTVNGGTGSVITAAAPTSGGLPFTGFEAGAAVTIGLVQLPDPGPRCCAR